MTQMKLLRIGIVGIGDIAQKAYLPVLSRIPNSQIIPCTRNPDTLQRILEQYHLPLGALSLDELIRLRPSMIFLCTSTDTHFTMAQTILEAGIPLHIDKPLSLSVHESQTLVALSEHHHCPVAVGFNRRFVPWIAQARFDGQPDLVIYQKNRILPKGLPLDDMITGDFIHVVDTCRFLLNAPVTVRGVRGDRLNDRMIRVTVCLETHNSSAIGIMNYDSGGEEERIEIFYPGEKRIVTDLQTFEMYRQHQRIHVPHSGWDSHLSIRGFEAMIHWFIDHHTDYAAINLMLRDHLITHEVCDQIVTLLKSQKS